MTKNQWHCPVLLFKEPWNLEETKADHPDLALRPIALPRKANETGND